MLHSWCPLNERVLARMTPKTAFRTSRCTNCGQPHNATSSLFRYLNKEKEVFKMGFHVSFDIHRHAAWLKRRRQLKKPIGTLRLQSAPVPVKGKPWENSTNSSDREEDNYLTSKKKKVRAMSTVTAVDCQGVVAPHSTGELPASLAHRPTEQAPTSSSTSFCLSYSAKLNHG